jgi:hypothetical protein
MFAWCDVVKYFRVIVQCIIYSECSLFFLLYMNLHERSYSFEIVLSPNAILYACMQLMRPIYTALLGILNWCFVFCNKLRISFILYIGILLIWRETLMIHDIIEMQWRANLRVCTQIWRDLRKTRINLATLYISIYTCAWPCSQTCKVMRFFMCKEQCKSWLF